MTVLRFLETRWVMRVLAIVACATLLFVAIKTIGVSSAVDAQKQSAARNDCRSEINAKFQEKKDRLVDLRAESQLEINRASIARFVNAPVDLQAAYDQFVRTDAALAEAKAVVDKLPRLDLAVEHGYTLDGVHHSPCPKVD